MSGNRTHHCCLATLAINGRSAPVREGTDQLVALVSFAIVPCVGAQPVLSCRRCRTFPSSTLLFAIGLLPFLCTGSLPVALVLRPLHLPFCIFCSPTPHLRLPFRLVSVLAVPVGNSWSSLPPRTTTTSSSTIRIYLGTLLCLVPPPRSSLPFLCLESSL